MEICSKRALVNSDKRGRDQQSRVLFRAVHKDLATPFSVQIKVEPHFSPSVRLGMPCGLCEPRKCDKVTFQGRALGTEAGFAVPLPFLFQ